MLCLFVVVVVVLLLLFLGGGAAVGKLPLHPLHQTERARIERGKRRRANKYREGEKARKKGKVSAPVISFSYTLAPSGGVKTISPVMGLVNIFSLEAGSIISTHSILQTHKQHKPTTNRPSLTSHPSHHSSCNISRHVTACLLTPHQSDMRITRCKLYYQIC